MHYTCVSSTAVTFHNFCFYISSSLINKRMNLFSSNSTESDGSGGAPGHPEPWDTSPQLGPDNQARVTIGDFCSPSLLTCASS